MTLTNGAKAMSLDWSPWADASGSRATGGPRRGARHAIRPTVGLVFDHSGRAACRPAHERDNHRWRLGAGAIFERIAIAGWTARDGVDPQSRFVWFRLETTTIASARIRRLPS